MCEMGAAHHAGKGDGGYAGLIAFGPESARSSIRVASAEGRVVVERSRRKEKPIGRTSRRCHRIRTKTTAQHAAGGATAQRTFPASGRSRSARAMRAGTAHEEESVDHQVVNHAFGEQVDEIGAEGNEQQKNKGQRGTGQGDAAGMKQITERRPAKRAGEGHRPRLRRGETRFGGAPFFQRGKSQRARSSRRWNSPRNCPCPPCRYRNGGGLPGQRHAETRRRRQSE